MTFPLWLLDLVSVSIVEVFPSGEVVFSVVLVVVSVSSTCMLKMEDVLVLLSSKFRFRRSLSCIEPYLLS